MIPVLVPKLPVTQSLVPYLQQIDDVRIYSNYGPLQNQFASRLAHLTNAKGVTLTCNGTLALELALRALNLPHGGICFMPSYTFVASAHAVVNAGNIPYFLDVDQESLALTPEIVKEALGCIREKPAVILVVSAFGAPMDIDVWDEFSDQFGIPVVFDGAAAITSVARIGKHPICVSLHATKTLGIGEGGAVLTSSKTLSERVTAMTGFGFTGSARVSQYLGGNYRISEYTAAIGLAALDELPDRVARLKNVAKIYRSALKAKKTRMQKGFGESWLSATLNVRVPEAEVDQTIAKLESAGIAWRRWWGDGCHTHEAFATARHHDLLITNTVARQIVGLPFYEDITAENIQEVVNCLP